MRSPEGGTVCCPSFTGRRRGARLAVAILFFILTGCGIYFKTYHFKGISPGMSEEDVMTALGNPLSIQNLGAMQVWRFLPPREGVTRKKEYFLVWFQDGHVVKWGTTEEEKVVPSPY